MDGIKRQDTGEWETAAHGGDIVTYLERYGRAPLDFSANTNPLGTPFSVREAVLAALESAHRYPDPLCRGLRDAIAEWEGVKRSQVLCGNGAADLIYRLVLAVQPREALITAPTFSEYRQALELAGCRVAAYPLRAERGFAVEPDILEQITFRTGLVFLCEPNNPTGITTPPGLLFQIAERCGLTGALLVLDECFNGFLDDLEGKSCKGLFQRFPGMVILRAFTKLYGMAGLRLGYLLGADEELLERVSRCGQPWPVSSLAQAAGIAALGDSEYVRRSRALVREERERLLQALETLGLRTWPGEANYLLFYSRNHRLHLALAERGILIRDCAGYEGLGAGYYRVAVRTAEENSLLLAALAAAGREG